MERRRRRGDSGGISSCIGFGCGIGCASASDASRAHHSAQSRHRLCIGIGIGCLRTCFSATAFAEIQGQTGSRFSLSLSNLWEDTAFHAKKSPYCYTHKESVEAAKTQAEAKGEEPLQAYQHALDNRLENRGSGVNSCWTSNRSALREGGVVPGRDTIFSPSSRVGRQRRAR